VKPILSLSLAALLCSCAGAPRIEGSAAPDFYLTDQFNKVWSTQAMHDDTVLVDFWATWCVPCLEGIPDLNAFNEKYGAKVKLLGIAIEEKGWDAVTPSAIKHGITYPVTVGQANLAKAYQVEGFPTLVLIQHGKVLKVLTGKHKLGELEAELAGVLR